MFNGSYIPTWEFPWGSPWTGRCRHKMRKDSFWKVVCAEIVCIEMVTEAGKVPVSSLRICSWWSPSFPQMGCSIPLLSPSLHGVKLPFLWNFPASYHQSTNFANLNVKKFYLVFICISHIAPGKLKIFSICFPISPSVTCQFPHWLQCVFLLIFRRSL